MRLLAKPLSYIMKLVHQSSSTVLSISTAYLQIAPEMANHK